MTDYLEPLLEQRDEDGEEGEAPALDETFPRKWRARAAPEGPDGPVPSAAPGGYAAAFSAEDGGAAETWEGLSAPDPLSPAEERAGASAALAQTPAEETPRRGADTSGPEGGRGGSGAAGLSDALRESGGAGGAASSLLRRLRAAAPEALPARRAAVFQEEPVSAPEADWEAFDRRLERDARRYDGGLEPY